MPNLRGLGELAPSMCGASFCIPVCAHRRSSVHLSCVWTYIIHQRVEDGIIAPEGTRMHIPSCASGVNFFL